MQVEIIETPTLGNRGYLIHDGSIALAIDVQRDFSRWIKAADTAGVTITHIFETHMHNDYVTGGYNLANELEATYVVPAGSNHDFSSNLANDGDIYTAGKLKITAILTPGHTETHTSYAVTDSQNSVVCTGGSLLYGTVGRTDLIGKDKAYDLTSSQYDSVHKLIHTLPGKTKVFPTHGFGSFCSSSNGSGVSESTIEKESETNVVFKHSKQSFIETILSGLGPYPKYYAYMDEINRNGPKMSKQLHVHDYEVKDISDALQSDNTWVVDIRSRKAFATSHPEAALGIELGGSFATYSGWVLPWADEIILVGDNEKAIRQAHIELSRIGMDSFISGATHNLDSYFDSSSNKSYQIKTFDDLKSLHESEDAAPYVLDVRFETDWGTSHVHNSVNIPLHELRDGMRSLPTDKPIWVHCASGYRASIAASFIDRSGRTPILIDDTYDNAVSLQLTD